MLRRYAPRCTRASDHGNYARLQRRSTGYERSSRSTARRIIADALQRGAIATGAGQDCRRRRVDSVLSDRDTLRPFLAGPMRSTSA